MKSKSQRYTSLPTSEPTAASPSTPNPNGRDTQYKELPQPPPSEIESEHASTSHHHHHHHHRQKTHWTRRHVLALLLVILILLTTNTLLLLRLLLLGNNTTKAPASASNISGISSPGPAHPKPYTFSETPYRLFDKASDALWQDIDPPNGGFYVASSEVDGARHAFGISMYHQLHCLMHLRGVLRGAARALDAGGEGNNGTEGDAVGERGGKVVVDLVHAGHCLDYIRQGILCAADDTIEPPHIHPNALDFITGLDVTHQCRDAGAVRQMAIDSGLVSDGEED